MVPATSAQNNIGTEKYPETGIIIILDVDEYFQGYSQNNEAFSASKKMMFSNHVYRMMILDLQLLGLLMLISFYMFSIYDISKISQFPNLLK